jgi:hypothetical protein
MRRVLPATVALTLTWLVLPVAAGEGGAAHAATVCVPSTASPTVAVDASPRQLGETIAFHGTGWCHPTDGGSTIAVKIDAGDYSRPDTSVSSNKSIWAIVQADPATGDFSGSFTLPDGTAATSTPAFEEGDHTLSFLSGSLESGDTVRSMTAAFTIGAVGTGGGGDTAAKGPCTPTTAAAQVKLASTTATLGGTVHVTGTGFCNPAGGGSLIGVKIDDGAYAHPGGSTTWAKIQADDADGTFSADITLPDGTAATSDPVFPRGSHTLRFLTGSLAAGDTVRTLKSEPFVIGAYRPADVPDPVDPATLRRSERAGVTARLGKHRLRVRVPHRPAGTWVYVTLYDADGSPRYPWSAWRRLDAQHRLVLPRKAITAAGVTGHVRLVVQSGDEGHVGDLLGWTRLALPDPTATTTSTTTGTPAAPTVAPPAPTSAPAAPTRPFATYADLDPARHGSVRAGVSGALVTLTARKASAGDRVFVYAYTAGAVRPVGWATLDAHRSTAVDLGDFSGYAGLTVQDAHGTLLGWAPVQIAGAAGAASAAPAATPVPTPAEAPASVAVRPVGSSTDDGVGWLSGLDGLLLALGALVLAAASLTTSLPGLRRTPRAGGPA